MRTYVRSVAILILVLVSISLTVSTSERNSIYKNSVEVWKSMVEGSPNKRRPHQNYGQALSTAGKLHEALNEFKTVLSLDDDGSVPMRDTYREIGVVYFRLGLFDEAIIAWQKGLEYAPYDAGLLNNLAIAFMKLKRLDEAASYAEAAVRSSEYMPEPLNTLGEISLNQGNPRKAAEYFKRYLYLRPEDSRGYWNTALALREAGEFEEALKYATRFLALESDPRYRQTAVQLVDHLKNRLARSRR
jgi:tetratricopeptide (TPR) repeat protein